jgi:hypothetical protein
MVVRGGMKGGGEGEGDKGQRAHSPATAPAVFVPPRTGSYPPCSPCAHLSPAHLFVPPTLVCTTCVHLYPLCSFVPLSLLLCLLAAATPTAVTTAIAVAAGARFATSPRQPPGLRALGGLCLCLCLHLSALVQIHHLSLLGPGLHLCLHSPPLLAGLLICCCCCCHECSCCAWVLCLTPPGIGLGSPKGGGDKVVSMNFYVSKQ